MAVLVRRHLGQTENSIAALEAVVVCLLVGVRAGINAAVLRWREFLKSGRKDRVGFLVLAAMGYHFIGIRAHEIAFKAMEVRCFILHCAYRFQHESIG